MRKDAEDMYYLIYLKQADPPKKSHFIYIRSCVYIKELKRYLCMYRLKSCSKYILNFKSKLQRTCRIRQNSMQYLCTHTCMNKSRDTYIVLLLQGRVGVNGTVGCDDFCFMSSLLIAFSLLFFFLICISLDNLYSQSKSQTYDPKIKSSQPGPPLCCSFN